MFKLLLCVALAAAAAPPRISLDLAAVDRVSKMGLAKVITHKKPSEQKHSQDFSEICPAGATTDNTNCPFPAAKAYDHLDKEVDVVTRVYLVDANGFTANKRVGSVDFTKRSTYLFKYDAEDTAGNKASQVVFALMLDDQKKPTITLCGGEAETVEAATSWKLCQSGADDNIDGDLTKEVKYTVKKVGQTKPLLVKGLYNQASKVLNTKQTGQFLVTMFVTDNAKLYGKDGDSNVRYARKAILMQDTTRPKISVHGKSPAMAECDYRKNTYEDAGAGAYDTLDGKFTPITNDNTNTKMVGDYAVWYKATDKAGNNARKAKRTVTVRDTVKPVIRLKGKNFYVVHSETKRPEPGARVWDACDKRLNAKIGFKSFTMKWVGTTYTDKKLGVYTRKYSTVDQSGNKNSVTRKFKVVDVTAPIMVIHGKNIDTVEAKNGATYSDQGATCEDYVDGKVSCKGTMGKSKKCHHHKGDKAYVVASANRIIKEGKVNMAVPGMYTLKYSCMDKSANLATMTRKVLVRDTTCPKIAMKGKSVINVEAGFPYSDAGASANDNLDGDITKNILVDGDTVDTANAFYSRESCKDIKANFPEAKTGNYYITRYVTRTTFKRVSVWCQMDSANALTFKACVNCKARIATPYFGKGARKSRTNSCSQWGLQVARLTGAQLTAAKGKWTKGINFFPMGVGSTDDYLCSTNDENSKKRSNTKNAKATKFTRAINRAEAGKFVIEYHVSDKAGNKECATPRRVVIVRDTLAPVITLHLKKKLIHKSDSSKLGLGKQKNPAGTKSNPNIGVAQTKSFTFSGNNKFMAETSSVNGWMIGAIASAVTGAALLSFSAKSSVTIEV